IIPVFVDDGGAPRPCSQVDLARALNLAVQEGAQIINIGAGQFDLGGAAHPILADAIRLCARNGILVVAAAGNDGCECLHIPAAEPSVLVVGAMDSEGAPLDFSNWGKEYRSRGLLAPGSQIPGAAPGGGMALRTGTSFATPIVSGVAALLLSIQLLRGDKPNAQAVRDALINSAIGCEEQAVPNCNRLLAGRLNPAQALAHLIKGGNVKMSEHLPEAPDSGTAADAAGRTPATSTSNEPAAAPSSAYGASANSPASAAPVRSAYSGSSVPVASSFPARAVNPLAVGITPSGSEGCSCGGGGSTGCSCGKKTPPALVYALGELGYDFGSEARRDSYLQLSGKPHLGPREIVEHLNANPTQASGITWTLSLEGTPVYALQPAGAFAAETYKMIRDYYAAQISENEDEHAERVSIPGYSSGGVTLMNGQKVPYIYPEDRGMFSWTTKALVTHVLSLSPPPTDDQQRAQKAEDIRNFLDVVYYQIRNLGLTPQERAINYAATNAFQIERIYGDAISNNLKLDSIDVERSAFCRPESDCWDVKLTFFDSHNRLEVARKVYRYTVDVSDVLPVTVGKVRSWRIF
ncbi:MAG TPA: PatA/PatG family cyanobactin maturation protease, partial [Blastocatellia bacterium]